MGVLRFRVALPAGLATAIGSLPQLNAFDASKFVREFLPSLPAAPSVSLTADASRLGRTTGPQVVDGDLDMLVAVKTFLESLRGRVEPVVLSLTGPVTLDLRLLSQGVDRERAASLAR